MKNQAETLFVWFLTAVVVYAFFGFCMFMGDGTIPFNRKYIGIASLCAAVIMFVFQLMDNFSKEFIYLNGILSIGVFIITYLAMIFFIS